MSFATSTLGEICDEVGGTIQTGPFGSQLHRSDYKNQGTPVVMPKDLVDGKVSVESIARIDEATVARLARHKLEVGDIVYARRGDIGRRALITDREAGWLCGTGCIRLGLGYSVVHPVFLNAYLGLPEVVAWIYNQAIGATMPNLNTSIVRSITVTYPPLPTQRKIAAILSAYDDLIENNTRRISILEEIAQNLYREWFVHFRFPGHESVAQVDSPLGQIPEGWEISSLLEKFPDDRDIVKTGPFGSKLHAYDYRDVGVPLILVKHVKNGRILEQDLPLVGEHKLDELAAYRLKDHDIVVTRVGYVGDSAYIHPHCRDWLFSGQMLRVRIPENHFLDARFLAQQYQSASFRQLIENYAVGATRLSLNTKILSSMPLHIPPFHMQEAYHGFVAPIDECLQNLQKKNSNLRRTRDLLLPRLISGQLDVSDLPIDIGEADR